MNKNIKSSFIGILTGVLNGLFGSGGGTIVVPAMERILKIEPHKAHASAIAVILPLSILSSIIYIRGEPIDLQMIFFVCIGGVFGGFIGAKVLKKISSNWLHKIFGVFMIIAAFKMIF